MEDAQPEPAEGTIMDIYMSLCVGCSEYEEGTECEKLPAAMADVANV